MFFFCVLSSFSGSLLGINECFSPLVPLCYIFALLFPLVSCLPTHFDPMYLLFRHWVTISMLTVCFVSCFFIHLGYLVRYGCCWICLCVDCISVVLFQMLSCVFFLFSPCIFLCPGLLYILAWCCTFRLHFPPFICSFSCWFGAVH